MKLGEIKRLAQHLKGAERPNPDLPIPTRGCLQQEARSDPDFLLAMFSFVKMKNYFITNSNSRDAHLLTSFACNLPFLLCTYKIGESNGTVNKTDGRIYQLALLGAGSQTKNKLPLRLHQLCIVRTAE